MHPASPQKQRKKQGEICPYRHIRQNDQTINWRSRHWSVLSIQVTKDHYSSVAPYIPVTMSSYEMTPNELTPVTHMKWSTCDVWVDNLKKNKSNIFSLPLQSPKNKDYQERYYTYANQPLRKKKPTETISFLAMSARFFLFGCCSPPQVIITFSMEKVTFELPY